MNKTLAFVCLLTLLTLGCPKAMVGGKVIVALNCGSKDEVVDSHDKVFKYNAVYLHNYLGLKICLWRFCSC